MQIKISECECQDVARLMGFIADRQDTPPQCSSLMKRGASLLIQLSAFCTMLSIINDSKNENGGE